MGKIRCLFIGMDGIVHAELIPQNKREIELLDGNHPIAPPAIFYDIDERIAPIYVCWHGLPTPEGIELDSDSEKAFIKEAVHMVQHKQKPLISRRIYRMIWHDFVLFVKCCFIGITTVFVLLLLRVMLF